MMDDLIVLIGTNDGLHALDGDAPRMPAGHAMNHVVAAPTGLWAVADERTLWNHPALGQGRRVAELDDERANCVLVAGDRVLVGGSGASLFELSGGALALVASFDETPGRSSWYTPWGGPPDIRSMAVGTEGTLYVNVHVGGIVRSTDGGASWTDTMEIHADVHEVIAHPVQSGHAYAATARGLATTTTGGDTWEFSTEGLHGSYCRAVVVTSEAILVSASSGSSGRRAALYRRSLHGGAFERCEAGLPEWFSTNLNTFCLAARDHIVIAGDDNGTVYRSDDGGITWTEAVRGLPGVRCVAIVDAPHDDNR
jgi:photosystem II stability/assembly factor-like uncharacterized protein